MDLGPGNERHRRGPGSAGRRWAAGLLALGLAGCGVSTNDGQAMAPATTATTTTADPVLPGLGLDADDQTSATVDRGPTDTASGRDQRNDEPDSDDAEQVDDQRHDAEYEAAFTEMLADYRSACAGSDERACDLLFLWSDEGSADHDFGADCGGRQPGTDEYCTPSLELDEDGWADPRHPAIAALGEQCRDADGVACDLLFYVLDDEEPLAEVGRSCDGRFPDGPPVSCTSDT